jgi:hypothetical protein
VFMFQLCFSGLCTRSVFFFEEDSISLITSVRNSLLLFFIRILKMFCFESADQLSNKVEILFVASMHSWKRFMLFVFAARIMLRLLQATQHSSFFNF